nr:hypothetical protein BaRGS_004780 [Batillaria attramentaria]
MNVYHVPMGNFRDLSAHEVESTPEENYNNSSLIKVGNGLAVYSAYHDDRLETVFVEQPRYKYNFSVCVSPLFGSGWVTLLPWRLPQFMGPQQIWYQGQLISNNDCLYRTMATSTYTAFHDIDELIVPHATDARSVRTKVMVAPQRVFEVGIHHVSKQLLEPWVPRPMDPQVALLHHYRECIRDFGMRCDNWIKDTIIRDRFMPELKDNFARAIKTLSL